MADVPYVPLPQELPATYEYGPDSFVQPGVPRGTLDERTWDDSRVFPGTTRRFWIYVPAGYAASEPAPLLVMQDAQWYIDPKGRVRAPIVLDNLIHRGDMPPAIAVLVDASANRNAEYDAFDGAYAQFLLNEIIPAVRADYAITDDPDWWAVGGGSSGGNCAFTTAWLRSDRFRRVYCTNGSFVQMPGGNPYPNLIRETPRKPLRIWLEAATRDLYHDQPEDNWLSSNLAIAATLAERGYDFRLVVGDGAHGGNHGGVRFPDAMRWLWA